MPAFVLNTLAGPIHYQLRRRGHTWHFDFHYQSARFRESTKTHDLAKAKGVVQTDILKALQTQAFDGKKLLLKDAVTLCCDARWPRESQRIRNRTFHDFRHRLLTFAKGERGERDVAAMGTEEITGIIQEYLNERRNDPEIKSAETVVNDQRAIHRLFSWLMEPPPRLSLTRNPAGRKLLTLPKIQRHIKPPADEELVNLAMKMAAKLRLFPVLVLMQSGFRPVGCTRVLWKHVRLGAKPMIEVYEKGLPSHIPLGTWAAKQLAAWKAFIKPVTDDAHVYPYTVEVAHRHFRELRAKMPHAETLTLQAIRRLSYRRLYEAGVSPQIAAKIMRSSVTTAMKHYVDLQGLTAHDAADHLAPASQKASQRKKRKTRPKSQSKPRTRVA